MEMLIVIIVLGILDLAALRWGFDSRDGVGRGEWKRMADWRGYHGAGNSISK
jgi:hypothetical protein